MKEIKFRSVFFDYKDDKFSHFNYWGFINHKNEYDQRCFTSPGTSGKQYRKFENQYTGLKSKDGKDIYANDILKFVSNSRMNVLLNNEDLKERIEQIYWNGNKLCWWVGNLEDGFQPSIKIDNNKFEVIGDIYSNPELVRHFKQIA